MINASVNVTVNQAINGGDLRDNLVGTFGDAAIMTALAGVQHKIGDFGKEHGLPKGGVEKILAHAIAGGLASELAGGDFADGALAASLAEATGPLLGNSGLDRSTQIELQRLISTAAVLIANDGDADGASFAAGVGASAHEHNYLKHDELADAAIAVRELSHCKGVISPNCSQEQIDHLERVVSGYKAISATNTARMLSACEAGQASCRQMVEEARWFNDQLFPPGRPSERAELIPVARDFVVESGDALGFGDWVNVDAIAVQHFSRAIDGEISYDEAAAAVRQSALNHESGAQLVVGGMQVAGGVAAVAACVATSGLACIALGAIGGANVAIGANTASEGVAQLLSNENERTLIENGLIDAGYTEAEAAHYLANAELLVGIVDIAAGGVLVIKSVGGNLVRVERNRGGQVGGVDNPQMVEAPPSGTQGGVDGGNVASNKLPDFQQGTVNGQYTAINPGPLDDGLAGTFSGGRYTEVVLDQDVILNRAGTGDTPLGQFFTKSAPDSVISTRIDSAVLPEWPGGGTSPLDTVFEVRIPAGTKVYVGEVNSQGGFYVGGTQQIVVPKPWLIDGVEVVGSTPLQ